MEWYPPDVDKKSYIFSCSSNDLPTNPLLMPSVGNGHISTVVYRNRVFMNGLYNGEGKKTHRAAIPAVNRVKLKSLSDAISTYSLDCIKGTFTHSQSNETVIVQHLVCAHRTIPSLLINQIRIQRVPGSANGTQVNVDLEVGTDFVSPDVNLQVIADSESTTEMKGRIKETEVPGDISVQITSFYIYMDKAPSRLVLKPDTDAVNYTFIVSVNSLQQQCMYQYNKGHSLLKSNELVSQHYEGWTRIWQTSRIDIWSDEMKTNQVVYGCQYYLLSSLPSQYEEDCVVDEFYGLSPESLACGDGTENGYLGHVFWDQETWMYPPILFLHSDIARKLLDARLRVRKQAAKNAEKNRMKGVQFPWEQGATGVPVSPSDDCEKYELHINADIALAIRNYCYITGTAPDNLTDLSAQLSDYWVSRLSWLEDRQKYGILGVMPPDEWHYPVNNSAYTNMAAKLAIAAPNDISSFSSHPKLRADVDVYVPFDKDLNYHPEFDGYTIADTKTSQVKQADVVLIGYPLDAETNKTVRENDLNLYKSVTTEDGPAMTWSMFCIGHMELGEPMKAADMFHKQLLQATQPFQVWSEYPDGTGAINFITGMGGFLQSVLNGYVGIRIRATDLTLQPALPPSSSRLKVTGLGYHGAKFNIDITSEEYAVMRTDDNTSLSQFYLQSADGSFKECLNFNSLIYKPVSFSTVQIVQ